MKHDKLFSQDRQSVYLGRSKRSACSPKGVTSGTEGCRVNSRRRDKLRQPYYKYHGMLAGFDAYKDHIGFEIWANKLDSEDRKKLNAKGYKTGSRTFHIGYDQKVPSAIIKRMVKAQARKNEAKTKKE